MITIREKRWRSFIDGWGFPAIMGSMFLVLALLNYMFGSVFVAALNVVLFLLHFSPLFIAKFGPFIVLDEWPFDDDQNL